ncbi:MAG TPA: porin [Burkholderiales bacterium]|nr:porin [Burkholderiales bacterium]
MRVPSVAQSVPQQKLLVAAVATACALPAAALAQLPAGVEVYGRANVSYERITVDSTPSVTNWEAVDNSSRIGVRGRKDLGDGLSGFFQVESRVRLDSGGDTLSSRDSYLGMQGGFGTVRVGRTIGPVYYATYDYISNHNHDTGTSSDALLAPTVFGNQGFMNNTLWYSSPKLGPFTFDVALSRLDEARVGSLSQPQYLGLVGAYDQGPLHVAVSHANTKDDRDLTGGGKGSNDTATTIGGLYDWNKKVIIGALYETAKNDLATGSAKRNYFRVSVMVPVDKHEFHFNLGSVNHRLDQNASDDGAKQWTLGYNYNIDKQFKVYAFYTVVDNEANSANPTQGGNYGFASTTGPGIDNKSLAVGARYNF